MRKIILASGSPRRKELLHQIGLEFEIVPSEYEEDMSLSMSPKKLAAFLALNKALAVAKKFTGQNVIIVAADTFVVYKNHRLGKPQSEAKALAMLKKLNGKTHSVITGFAIIDGPSGKKITRTAETKLTFRKLSDIQLKKYIASGETLDKAGAYAIQGRGAALIKKIDGDYYNVVGLPLASLLDELEKFNIKILV
jgi:septum formation protein